MLEFIIINLDETSTFRQWWLPSNENTKFRAANKCQCQSSPDATLNDNVVHILRTKAPSTCGLENIYYVRNIGFNEPGVIGLTSHDRIHGNMISNAYIHDIDVKHFDVAGYTGNGCQFTNIDNIIICPQNKNIFSLERYTQSGLKYLNDRFNTEEIQFYERDVTTIIKLCQRMDDQMDMIYNNYINGIEYNDNDKEWIATQKIYTNENGWMDGESSYNMVINNGGAGTHIEGTSDIIMNNIEIFGICNQVKYITNTFCVFRIPVLFVYKKAREKMKFTIQTVGTSRAVTDWVALMDQIPDRTKSPYIGDVYTDG